MITTFSNGQRQIIADTSADYFLPAHQLANINIEFGSTKKNIRPDLSDMVWQLNKQLR